MKEIEGELLASGNAAGCYRFPSDKSGVPPERNRGGLAKPRTGERNDRFGQIFNHGVFANLNSRGKSSHGAAGAVTINPRGADGSYLNTGARRGVDRKVERIARQDTSRDIVQVNQSLTQRVLESTNSAPRWLLSEDEHARRSAVRYKP
jgi:hypothetical protein